MASKDCDDRALVYAEYKASVAQQDLADRTLEVAHKASVAS